MLTRILRSGLVLFFALSFATVTSAVAQQAAPAPSLPGADQKVDTSKILRDTDKLVEVTASLRGLAPLKPIQKGVKSREEITAYLTKKINEEYLPERIDGEGRMFKKLGLLSEKVDYRQLVVNLLTDQVQGFYDPEEQVLYIASWLPMIDQESVMVHEITHALQDQHFDLRAIFRANRASDNDDRALAQQALFEGDGTVTALQYTIAPLKRHFSQLPDLAFVMETQMEVMRAQSPVLSATPPFLQEVLVFPYSYGSSFIQAIWKHSPGWETVNRIYADLPASTEQIMHPAKYYETRDNPLPVNAAALSGAVLGAEWKVAYKTVLGEFMLGQLLDLHLNTDHAKRAATGWGGDEALLLENSAGKTAAWLETVWDSAADAEKFSAAMDEWFRLRFPKAIRGNVTPAGFTLVQNGEFSALQRNGTSVRIVLGLPEADGGRFATKP